MDPDTIAPSEDPSDRRDLTGRGGRGRVAALCLTSAVCVWIMTSAFVQAHSAGLVAVTWTLGGVAFLCSLLAIPWPGFRYGVAGAGVLMGFAVLPFSGQPAVDHFSVIANHVVCGVLLLVLGLYHRIGAEEVVAPRPVSSQIRAAWRVQSPEERRFLHGLGWGAVATVVMGIVILLAMAIGLWPSRSPISLLLVQRFLGPDLAPFWAWLLVGTAHLAYGALCGGLLTTFSEPVDMRDALALGLLRWLTTQFLFLPALGWAEFGLGVGVSLAVATAIPQLAYAVSLGLLLRRDDERILGRHPVPAPA
jgi:hypothetical protein